MLRYRLENRYQDSGWEDLETPFANCTEAIACAGSLAKDSIIYGMTRVVDLVEGEVVITFAAGGGVVSE